MQLFCLAHAGASAMPYARWRRRLPRWLEICPLELPGRGARAGEALLEDFEAVLADLQRAWQREHAGPYLIWGHSLGALLGFELAHRLIATGHPAPLALFASASRAPSRRALAPRLANGSEAELLAALDGFARLPRELLADPLFRGECLPVLRGDFALAERYHYRRRAPLPCAVHVLGGRQDQLSEEDLRTWRRETRAAFSLHWLEGDHFYLRAQESELLQLIEFHASRLLRDEAAYAPLGA
ncbi:MAG: alpha/beta fold hydrolase [Pseudomonas sp.]|uniref:thioesterase II family protein n=1 Tax=Pseudomonas sp. TaxID=306 RepID=UPI00339B4EC1